MNTLRVVHLLDKVWNAFCDINEAFPFGEFNTLHLYFTGIESAARSAEQIR
jgi:hypothetical protein